MASTSNIKTADKEQLLLDARLKAQHLSVHDEQDLQRLIQKMGALQAQHFEMVQWAVCHRMGHCAAAPPLTGAILQKAFEQGKVVRTHALRPTWQLLAGEDLLWILQLTAPAIKKVLFGRDKHLGIEQKEYVRADAAIYRILSDRLCLSKQELVRELEDLGFLMDEYRSNHYIMHAELEGIICSGAVKNGKHSYGLVENVLGKNLDRAQKLKKEFQGAAGVKELAYRYFSTRGPASVADFAWWSGLNITQIKKALLGFGDQLIDWDVASLGVKGKKTDKSGMNNTDLYYLPALTAGGKFKKGMEPKAKEVQGNQHVQLIAAFDEYLISYKDRSVMLPAEFNRQIVTVNGMFRPAVVRGGKVLAGWQVEKIGGSGTTSKSGLKIKILPFGPMKPAASKVLLKEVEAEAASFARFRNMPLLSLQLG